MTTKTAAVDVDVLCVGHASFDLVFGVERHPEADEKILAESFLTCGGGPASNAAVTVARLGHKAAFCGYLGRDDFGRQHLAELAANGVDTTLLVQGDQPTPISVVLVKPNGERSVVNYRRRTSPLAPASVHFTGLRSKAVLFDGHEPEVSLEIASFARKNAVPLILDAGSVHKGTSALINIVDYAVCSEKFALQFTGASTIEVGLERLHDYCRCVVVTLGANGLVWRNDNGSAGFPAYAVDVVDTTGAGDVFHGAFALGIALAMDWHDLLSFASGAAALCCTKTGARQGIPSRAELDRFLEKSKN